MYVSDPAPVPVVAIERSATDSNVLVARNALHIQIHPCLSRLPIGWSLWVHFSVYLKIQIQMKNRRYIRFQTGWKLTNKNHIPASPRFSGITSSAASSSNGAASASNSCSVGAFVGFDSLEPDASSRRFRRIWANASVVDAISAGGSSFAAGGAWGCACVMDKNLPRPGVEIGCCGGGSFSGG